MNTTTYHPFVIDGALTDKSALHVHSYQLWMGGDRGAVSGISERGSRITRIVPKVVAESVAKAIDAKAVVWLHEDNTIVAFGPGTGIDIDDAGYTGPEWIDEHCERGFHDIESLELHMDGNVMHE